MRELRNALERAVILCEGGLVTSDHLPISMVAAAEPAAAPAALPAGKASLDAAEREMIVQALTRTRNNQSQAARQLGLSRSQLRSRMEKYGLTPEG